jgi:hypothetical protein
MAIEKRGRFWAVIDGRGELVCLCVYRKGAREVVRRLSEREAREIEAEQHLVEGEEVELDEPPFGEGVTGRIW